MVGCNIASPPNKNSRLMKRMTFEEASRELLAESRLSRIASEEVPATPWNWRQEFENDRLRTSDLIDKLCKDLSIVIERPIVRNSMFRSDSNWIISNSPSEQAAWTWKKFLQWYPNYLKQAIENLKAQADGDKVFTYPISHIRWDKGSASVELPNDMDEVTFMKLTEPVTVPCDANVPPHIKRKLELLEQTEYDYQPYILQSKDGTKVLAIRLGCQWRDIAIATFKKPQIKNINNVLIFLTTILFILFGVGLFGQAMIENIVLKVIITCSSLMLGLLGVLFFSLFIVKRYRPLKV